LAATTAAVIAPAIASSITDVGLLLDKLSVAVDDRPGRLGERLIFLREPNADLVRQRLAAFDHWAPTVALDDASLSEALGDRTRRQDGADEGGQCAEDAAFALLGDDILS
jgi:hypothetical protein